MKLNPEIIRDIMLSIEENLTIDEDGKVIPLSPNEIVEYPELSNYPKNEILFNFKELIDFNLLKKGKRYVGETYPNIIGFTEQGYKFIAAINSDTKWNKLKSLLKPLGIYTLKTLFEATINN